MFNRSHAIPFVFALLSAAAVASASVAIKAPPEPPSPPAPPENRPGAHDFFDRVDANGDGVIDRDEFKAARAALGRGGPRVRVAERRRRDQPDGKPGRGQWQDERHPRTEGGPTPQDGPGEIGRRIRHLVREAVEEALREHSPELRRIVREAVAEAMRDRGPRGEGRMDRDAPRGRGMGPGRMRGPGEAPPMAGPRGPGRDGDMGKAPPPRKDPGAGRKDRRNRMEQGGRGQIDEQADGENRVREQRRWRQADPKQPNSPRMRFRKMDANVDGFLTPDEFQGPVERFKMLDDNDDGKLSREEVRKAVQKFGGRRLRGDAPLNARRIVL